MWSPLTSGLSFLVNTVFTLYLFVLLVRVLLPAVGADYYNPFCQFIIKLTEPLIAPLQKILPRPGRFDTAAFIILFLFTCIKNWILLGLLLSAHIFWPGLVLLALAQILEMLIQFYFFAIIIQVILSWVQPKTYNPMIIILLQLTEPLLAPARRLIPAMSGLDLSSLAVIILLQLTKIVIVNPLVLFSLQLTIGIIR
jgi:YggT family protein